MACNRKSIVRKTSFSDPESGQKDCSATKPKQQLRAILPKSNRRKVNLPLAKPKIDETVKPKEIQCTSSQHAKYMERKFRHPHIVQSKRPGIRAAKVVLIEREPLNNSIQERDEKGCNSNESCKKTDNCSDENNLELELAPIQNSYNDSCKKNRSSSIRNTSSEQNSRSSPQNECSSQDACSTPQSTCSIRRKAFSLPQNASSSPQNACSPQCASSSPQNACSPQRASSSPQNVCSPQCASSSPQNVCSPQCASSSPQNACPSKQPSNISIIEGVNRAKLKIENKKCDKKKSCANMTDCDCDCESKKEENKMAVCPLVKPKSSCSKDEIAIAISSTRCIPRCASEVCCKSPTLVESCSEIERGQPQETSCELEKRCDNEKNYLCSSSSTDWKNNYDYVGEKPMCKGSVLKPKCDNLSENDGTVCITYEHINFCNKPISLQISSPPQCFIPNIPKPTTQCNLNQRPCQSLSPTRPLGRLFKGGTTKLNPMAAKCPNRNSTKRPSIPKLRDNCTPNICIQGEGLCPRNAPKTPTTQNFSFSGNDISKIQIILFKKKN